MYLLLHDHCQKANCKVISQTPELTPIPVKAPWFHIGIDLLNDSSHGNSLLHVHIYHNCKCMTTLLNLYKQ